MRESSTQHFVGLDIGTSAVRCVVAMFNQENGKPSIVGHGSADNQGMRKGVVTHVDDVTESVVQAITEAERVSGMRIENATVNVNGSHVGGIDSRGVIAISAANREITDEDRARVEDAATVVNLPANREIIQLFAKNYSVDGQANIKNPVGMHGVRLEADTHIVTAVTPNVRNLDMALEKAQVAPSHHTVSSLAGAEAVLSRQQKEAGTVLIDIGAGTTNLAVLEDGEVQHVAVLPIGSMYITNDLAIGLKTDLDVAEQVKIKHASAWGKQGGVSKIHLKHGEEELTFAASDVAMIAEARLEELFEHVDKELHKIKRSRKLPGGAVLIGATAQMPGLAEFAKEQLQLPARIGTLQPMAGLVDRVENPVWCTAVGLTLLDMLLPPEQAARQGGGHPAMPSSLNSALDKINRYFKSR
jgi:cell division protein FtsA